VSKLIFLISKIGEKILQIPQKFLGLIFCPKKILKIAQKNILIEMDEIIQFT
jgi:hypothetical protein